MQFIQSVPVAEVLDTEGSIQVLTDSALMKSLFKLTIYFIPFAKQLELRLDKYYTENNMRLVLER